MGPQFFACTTHCSRLNVAVGSGWSLPFWFRRPKLGRQQNMNGGRQKRNVRDRKSVLGATKTVRRQSTSRGCGPRALARNVVRTAPPIPHPPRLRIDLRAARAAAVRAGGDGDGAPRPTGGHTSASQKRSMHAARPAGRHLHSCPWHHVGLLSVLESTSLLSKSFKLRCQPCMVARKEPWCWNKGENASLSTLLWYKVWVVRQQWDRC